VYPVFFVTYLVTIRTITFYNLNEISLPYVGTARTHFINAIHCAKEGKYDEAAELIKQGDEAFSLGHNAHADLLTMDANGEISNGYMLLMHAEDQLMSAESFRILADEFIALYKRIDEK
jgi:cellobiose PTS system EIIA component